MKAKRHRFWDIVGIMLLAGWFASVAALVTYDPHDPVRPLASPVNDHAFNLLSLPGAWISAQLYDLLGWSLFPALAVWYLAGIALLLRHQGNTWIIRLLGCQLLVPSVALLAELAHWPLNTQWHPASGS